MQKVDEIRETVQEAFADMEDIGCNLTGLYNYIRYGNEDFGTDMIINDEKPIGDNSKIQHYYLVLFIAQALKLKYEIPEIFVSLYRKNKEKYNDDLIARETGHIEEYFLKI